MAGVFVCLIGRDGASFLHRVGPLYDAEDAAANLRTICEVRHHQSGGYWCVHLRFWAFQAAGMCLQYILDGSVHLPFPIMHCGTGGRQGSRCQLPHGTASGSIGRPLQRTSQAPLPAQLCRRGGL